MRRFVLVLAGAAALALFPTTTQAAGTVGTSGAPAVPAAVPESASSRDLAAAELTSQLVTTTNDRDQLKLQLTAVQADRDDLKSQVASLKEQLAAVTINGGRGGAAPVAGGGGSTANHFSYGFCTWYVATRRAAPWFGDAGQWPANAARMGFPEGQQPRPGAIMATWEGPIGHVAYVEAVNGDGSWVVSEMNYKGWNVVDRRTVRPGSVPLIAFIY